MFKDWMWLIKGGPLNQIYILSDLRMLANNYYYHYQKRVWVKLVIYRCDSVVLLKYINKLQTPTVVMRARGPWRCELFIIGANYITDTPSNLPLKLVNDIFSEKTGSCAGWLSSMFSACKIVKSGDTSVFLGGRSTI